MNNNNETPQPRISQMNIHGVKPEHISVVITEFNTFSGIDINIGKFTVQLFCETSAEAHAVCKQLTTYTTQFGFDHDSLSSTTEG